MKRILLMQGLYMSNKKIKGYYENKLGTIDI